MKTILDDKQRSICIIDNAFGRAFQENLYHFVMNSYFKIGAQDGPGAIETKSHVYLTSEYNEADVNNVGIMDALNKLPEWQQYKDCKLLRTSVNLSVPSDTNFAHTHKDELALIYYVNLKWLPEWAGETLFYNEDQTDIVYTSMYTPGRLIIFDGNIPHSITVQSTLAPHYRFSLAMFFSKK